MVVAMIMRYDFVINVVGIATIDDASKVKERIDALVADLDGIIADTIGESSIVANMAAIGASYREHVDIDDEE